MDHCSWCGKGDVDYLDVFDIWWHMACLFGREDANREAS